MAFSLGLSSLVSASVSWAEPTPAPGAIPQAALGLSNLLVRIQGEDEIGLAGGDFKVQVLERLRERGFHAVGAENLVFDKDESHRAAYRLGGTIRELECRKGEGLLRCRIGVEWQLLSVVQDAVVYTTTTRHAVLDMKWEDRRQLASRLLLGAVDELLQRGRFRQALGHASPEAEVPREKFSMASFAACPALKQRMPTASESVLAAAVVVRGEQGFGSGVFVSPDGLVLTAAHVLRAGAPRLRLRDGSEVEATPVRVARAADVALLRTNQPAKGVSCLGINPGSLAIGAEVYAVGAPADEKLAFSLTRGIVSGVRELDGQRKLQTDAAISPGNSGGPLVDGDANLVAIVTSKVVERRVEGIAFSAPIADALSALGLVAGTSTDEVLKTSVAERPAPLPKQEPVKDEATPVPSIDPEKDRQAAAAEKRRLEVARERREQARQRDIDNWRKEERARRTPPALRALFWTSLVAGSAGGITGVATYAAYDREKTKRADFRALNAANIVGWSLFGAGAAGLIVYAVGRPSLPDAPAPPPRASIVVRPEGIHLEGSF